MTDNNTCQRCGSCCRAVKPLLREEAARLIQIIAKKGLKPQPPAPGTDGVITSCPFLWKGELGAVCIVYEDRPLSCVLTECQRTPEETEELLQGKYAQQIQNMLQINMHNLFGLSGIVTNDEYEELSEACYESMENQTYNRDMLIGLLTGITTVDGTYLEVIPCHVDNENIAALNCEDMYNAKFIRISWSDIALFSQHNPLTQEVINTVVDQDATTALAIEAQKSTS